MLCPEYNTDLHCNWQLIGYFLVSVVQLLNHVLEWVVCACTRSRVALTGSLCVVVAISEHAY